MSVMRRAGLVMALGFCSVGVTLGCMPPPLPPGFVSTAPGVPRQFDLGAAAGVAAPEGDAKSVVGGGGLSIEPYATPRVSVPIDVGGGATSIGPFLGSPATWVGYAASRVGVRGRVHPHVAIGGGVGAAAIIGKDDDDRLVAQPLATTLDVEVASSVRWRSFALSGVVRPTFVGSQGPSWDFYGTMSVAPALFVTPHVALTGHLVGGPIVYGLGYGSGFIGGGLGVFVHI